MMGEAMIERVARAIFISASEGEFSEEDWRRGALFYSGYADNFRAAARVAIEAMREPTEQMAEVGFSVSADTIRSNRLGEERRNPPVEAWRAMIDVALERGDE